MRTDDINALFAGLAGPTVRVTRIRSDIAHAAMTADFVLQASTDQSELSNVRNVTQSVNLTCPIYNGCNVVGSGTVAQASAANSSTGSNAGFDAPTPASGGCTASPGGDGRGTGAVFFGGMASVFALLVSRGMRAKRRRSRGE